MLEPHLKLDLGKVSPLRVVLWLGLVLAISVAYVAVLLRTKESRPVDRMACCFIGFSLLCRLGWVACFDSYQYGDFGTYWNHGKLIATYGLSEPTLRPIYAQRALLYTAPIHLVFGDSQTALELINVFLISLSTALFYALGRRLVSARTAAGALLFFLWNPDIWYGATLADHDIAFLPLFSSLSLVIYRLDSTVDKRSSMTIGSLLLSITAGVLILLLDIQRGYGSPAIFALAFVALVRFLAPRERRPHNSGTVTSHPLLIRRRILGRGISYLILLLVLPCVTYGASFKLFRDITGIRGQGESILSLLTATDVYGSGGSNELKPWMGRYYPRLPQNLRTAFSTMKLLSEIVSDPLETIKFVIRKNIALAKPTTTLMFSVWGARDEEYTRAASFMRVNSSEIATQRATVHILAAIVYAFLALRLFFYRSFSVNSGALFLIFYTGFFYFFILFFTEAQGRYDVFTVFLVSLLVAQPIFDAEGLLVNMTEGSRQAGRSRRPALRAALGQAARAHGVGVIGLVVCVGLFFAVASWASGSRLTLVDMRGFNLVQNYRDASHRAGFSVNCPGVLIPGSIANNFKKLAFKADLQAIGNSGCEVCFEKRIPNRIRGTVGHLRCFVSAKPSGTELADLSYLSAVSRVANETVLSIPLNDIKSPAFVECSVNRDAAVDQISLSLCLVSNSRQGDGGGGGPEKNLTVMFEYLDVR